MTKYRDIIRLHNQNTKYDLYHTAMWWKTGVRTSIRFPDGS